MQSAVNQPADIADFRFTSAALNLADRRPGISAFMRIRDGAFSLEAAIRSHINHFDEIVAVHNRSTDATADILARLATEFGPKLRVFHYLPDVHPPGSAGHAREPAHSPHSLVNYYNFALCQTRFSHATKLDDDHIAMAAATSRLVADVRARRAAVGELACFSGVNLARDRAGKVGVLRHEPFAGNGDHWIFPVSGQTYFVWDRRFEKLQHPGMCRRFHAIAYWHLKYLKPDFGFANYELAKNPHSRYAKRLKVLHEDRLVIDLDELAALAAAAPRLLDYVADLGMPVPDRDRIIAARRREAVATFAGQHLGQVAANDAELLPFLSS
jgi:hypothetical protein